jgi:succinate dehydrogenase/fumarate reductase flavoprotein subunit
VPQVTARGAAASDVDVDADVLVIGAGMAGLTAAATAAAYGGRVVVVEAATDVGGSAALSGGLLWTARSFEALRTENPRGSPELGRVLMEGFAEGVEWIRSLGIEVGPETTPLQIPHGRGRVVDIIGYLQACRRVVLDGDGIVVLNARVRRLRFHRDAVAGAVVADRDGDLVVSARSTILCTGGFQGDRQLRRDHIGAGAADIVVRSNPYSDGAGLRLAATAGAATSTDMHGFYGHVLARPLARAFEPRDFIRLSQSIYSGFGIIVNVEGRRFVDESRGYYRNAQALVGQPQQRAIVIGDRWVRETYATQRTSPGMEHWDRPKEAEAEGCRVASADDPVGLAERVAEWGYPGPAVAATLADYNRAVSGGTDVLTPARSHNRVALVAPPFFAVEVQPAITFTHGGIAINDRTEVLDRRSRTVPGLLAAGADAGGVYSEGYAGGLSMALVFGRRAAFSSAAVTS